MNTKGTKTKLTWWGGPLVLVAMGLMLAGCQEEAADASAQVEAKPRPAPVMAVSEEEGLVTRNFTGRVEAVQTVDLAFRVGGQIVELPIRESQSVKKGDLIAALDPADYEAAVREAEVNIQQRKLDLDRYETLKDKEVISQGAYDSAKTAFDLASVQLENARRNLGYTKIYAPYDAVISSRLVDNFTIISPGTSVVRVQDVHEVQIDINVPERLFAQARAQNVLSMTAEFPAHPGKEYQLEYREHSTEADPITQTYRITLAMPHPEDINVFPGMTASVKIRSKQYGLAGTPGFLVPASAVTGDAQREPFVWVLNSETNAVNKRNVKIGTLFGPFVPVVEGLDEGELIVTAGVGHLQEGQVVRPVK
ncbi:MULTISPECIES: efflux RND transporter periplasmic adaptor subunit [Pseudovibrio]|uniref:efflux RND transporter periplasmic adaptor subunit n=1 Tax=Stappiaceae TaxID=2821832 RepID=UPI0023670D8A|nr:MULTISPECIES: efflux RND transporter periplasmic adaptor subunit [Pseudovibrio]MDD7910490.1 efflux RND transporter periplasmic adaptor subunit [Pseudovibrio exalbescens]MDX5594661.1 efflux RND transporter periplasmic adaptor subunit [Pseudovibrio sp. SPO723]